MKKKERYTRKNLRARLSAIMAIYMDGVDDKKKKKMEKYLDNALKDVVDYYVTLLKKKDKKRRVLPPAINELSILSKNRDSVNETTGIESLENNSSGSVEYKMVVGESDPGANELSEIILEENDGEGGESFGPENSSMSKSELPPYSMASDIAV
jgi:hypothetical protein